MFVLYYLCMCGITGCIGNNAQETVQRFTQFLTHRGPNANGIYADTEANVSLGQTRLSIIDLTTNANQPMIDDTGRYILVFNGEIYNYQELRKELDSQFIAVDIKSSPIYIGWVF